MTRTVAVLGAGPGGYAAAFEAAKLGADKVYLIEKDHVGGTCLNRGCIPTKTIMRTAHALHDIQHAADVALEGAGSPTVRLDALRARKESVVADLRAQIMGGVKKHKVEFIAGTGVMTAPHQITVTLSEPDETGSQTRVIDADIVIIATGSLPFKLPMLNFDIDRVWTSDEALELDVLPRSVVICGGGVIGAEFASAYAAFGIQTTVVELAATLLPGNDKRVTRALASTFKAQGVNVYTGVSVSSVEEREDGSVSVYLSNDEVLEADALLCAVGRVPNTEGFGFEQIGLEFDRRALKVNEYFETNIEGVYAIGDAIAGVMLAHVAEAEAKAAVANAFDRVSGEQPKHTVNYDAIPACVYTIPEIGVVGMSADGAKSRDIEAFTVVAKYAGNGKALAENDADGFAQLVVEKESGVVLGAQIYGAHAVELIHEISNAMSTKATVEQLAHPVYAHPTVSEVIKAAAEMAVEKRA